MGVGEGGGGGDVAIFISMDYKIISQKWYRDVQTGFHNNNNNNKKTVNFYANQQITARHELRRFCFALAI